MKGRADVAWCCCPHRASNGLTGARDAETGRAHARAQPCKGVFLPDRVGRERTQVPDSSRVVIA